MMNCFCVISHPLRDAVLFRHQAGVFELPSVQIDPAIGLPYQTEQISRKLQRVMGCHATVLRHLAHEDSWHAVELELQAEFPLNPLVFRWVGVDRLDQLVLHQSPDGLLLKRWCAGQESGAAAQAAAPWERKGWFREAERWILARTQEHGWQVTGPVLQVKGAWHRSCILFVGTSVGKLFFKACSGFKPAESRLTEALADLFPGEIPEIVAADHARNWMLMRDYGLNVINNTDLRDMPAALRRLAEMQLATARHLDLWRALECECWDAEGLCTELNALQDYLARMQMEYHFMDPALPGRLAAQVPRLQSGLAALFASELPITLVHREMRANHIIVADNGFVFIDWSDGLLAHPFFSLLSLLEYGDLGKPGHQSPGPGKLPGHPDWLAARDAFFDAHTEYAARERQLEILEQAAELFWVFRSLCMVSNWRDGTPGTPAHQRMLRFLAAYIDSRIP